MTQPDNHRPWGYYEILAETPTYKVKKIVVYPGKRLSLQKHQFRTEHWFAVHGTGIVTLQQQQIELAKGKSVDIPCGHIHRVENRSSENFEFIEVQTGEYFGEDDIIRIEDDYGRC